MIKLEELSREELKTKAQGLGLKDYHALSKAKLVKLLSKYEDGVSFQNENIVQLAFTKVLSKKAQQWKTYFKKVNITPQVFLERNPNHPFREFIEELIKNN